ncbi:MAG: transporter substrate-binding domain-containing protein [Chitinispirillales bacterium]|jgi:signal transduction histidine kinase/DNA-binding response OmpR family regulator|nr:transporter substrate-binding domain-containing protein [Chitinispirillales bacterium]
MKYLLLLPMFLFIALAGCGIRVVETLSDDLQGAPFYASYCDIPGVTDEEVSAIEAIRGRTAAFVYGGLPGTEAFKGEDGEIKGFIALFCELLTTLFGIPFEPKLYEWDDLIAGLESGEIDFTGELTAKEERRKIYFMTDPIALRTVKSFRLAGSRPIVEIAARRPLRYAFLDGAITGDDVKAATKDSIEMFFVDNYEIAYNMLKEREIDAFFEENTAEYVFDSFADIVTEYFFPLLFSDVSLTTRNPDFEPIISVVQKMLENGGDLYLSKLYNRGQQIYMQNKFLKLLTEEEREHLRGRTVIPLLAEYDNYPTSFYSVREKQWQGIVFDVIKEIEALTGLSFQVVNSHTVEWDELLYMLEVGEGSILTDLIRTPEREGRFLWPSNAIAYDYYALLSKSDFRDIRSNEIFHMTVGMVRGSAHHEMFRKWFPNHSKIVKYNCSDDLLKALETDEIDLAMSSRNQLLYLTNYLERVGYKINFLFDLPFESAFGFHLGEPLLCDIVDKALGLVNTQSIHDKWVRKVYDYRVKLAEERLPLMFMLGGLLLCVFFLLVILMILKRNEKKRLEREVLSRTNELNEAVQAAENANRAKSDFLATMSHEIRTPMNAIMGIAQIQLQKDDLSTEFRSALNKIYSSSSSLLEIINDILDLSKIETGKLELNPTEYDIPSLINDTAQVNVIRIGSKEIHFTVDSDSSLPSRLYGDELRLKQILNNLLSNAIKYTDKGHVKLSVSHSVAGENVLLRFSVEDTGQGFTSADKTKLFSKYQRFNVSTNRATEGTGLGLSVTKRLLEMMDGKIEVESEYGKGSVFTVEVVQKSVPCEPIGTEVSENLKKLSFATGKKDKRRRVHGVMPYGKILIVDDVDTNLYVAQGLLTPYRLNVEVANSGFAAVNLINCGKVYDIIFMDHMMPQMDGIETTQKIRALGYTAPIIALTANAIVGTAEMFRQNGFDGFISKPIDIRYMDTILNEFVRDRHPEEAKKYVENAVPALSTVDPKVLEVFRSDAEKAIVTLRETVQTGNTKLFAITAHAMKAALANIFESKKSQAAAALEKAGLDGDVDYMSANTESFIKSLEELIERLNSADNKRVSSHINEADIIEDIEYLVEHLAAIKTACENFDNTAVYKILDLIEEKIWKTKTTEVIKNIRALIYVSSDFEIAAENIQKFLTEEV